MYDVFTVLKTIDLYNQYKSYNKVAKINNLYRQTVTNWIKKYKFNLSKLNKRILSFKNHTSVKHNFNIINNNVLSFIDKIIYNNPFITKNDIKKIIKDEFNFKLSNKKINKIFKHLNLTKKKPKKYIVKNLDYINEISKLRDEFINKIKKENIDKIISIDETGCKKFITDYLYGYSKKGTKINIPLTNLSFKNQSIIMSLTTKNILTYEIIDDNINSNYYHNFIEKTIKLLKSKNYIFIFDNVSFHNTDKTLKLINDSGHKYIFIPPYSPNLNPIENINGILKNKIQKIKLNEISNDKIKPLTKIEKKEKINKNEILIKNKIKNEKNENKINYKNKLINKNDYKQKNKEIIIKNKKVLKCLNKEIRNTEKDKIKKYIKKAIEEINKEYNKKKLTSIFNHAFNYNYKKIEQELRDRIKFIK